MTVEALLALPLSPLCSFAITPVCIKELYQIPAATKAAKGNEMGIFEDLGDVVSQADLDLFYLTLAQ